MPIVGFRTGSMTLALSLGIIALKCRLIWIAVSRQVKLKPDCSRLKSY